MEGTSPPVYGSLCSAPFGHTTVPASLRQRRPPPAVTTAGPPEAAEASPARCTLTY
jgi:hypothetical protein